MRCGVAHSAALRQFAYSQNSPAILVRTSWSLGCTLLLECLRDDRKVAFSEPVIDDFLPFVGQRGKCPEPIAAGITQNEIHVLECKCESELD
jgi:hypothetical protein